MKTTEGHAVIEFNAAVGDVESIYRDRIALTEAFAERQIESRVLREVITRKWLAGKGIAEAGAIVDVG